MQVTLFQCVLHGQCCVAMCCLLFSIWSQHVNSLHSRRGVRPQRLLSGGHGSGTGKQTTDWPAKCVEVISATPWVLPIIMEVENGYNWKVFTIGGTHFLTSMIMGGSVLPPNFASILPTISFVFGTQWPGCCAAKMSCSGNWPGRWQEGSVGDDCLGWNPWTTGRGLEENRHIWKWPWNDYDFDMTMTMIWLRYKVNMKWYDMTMIFMKKVWSQLTSL